MTIIENPVYVAEEANLEPIARYAGHTRALR